MVRQYHNLGGASEIPILNRQAQPDTSALGMTEWTVLARIDGKRSIEALVKLLPLDESRVIESLLRLKALGMIEVGVKAPEPTPSRIRKPRMDTGSSDAKEKGKKTAVKVPIPVNWPLKMEEFVFEKEILDEDVVLDHDKRKQVIYYHYHLKRISYYMLFQIPNSASGRDVRRAYLKLSKEFHPDLFFRRELGSFRRMVEEIFQWISKGHDILMDTDHRIRYDAMLRGNVTAQREAPSDNSKAEPETKETARAQQPKEVVNNVVRAAVEAESKGKWERAWVLYKKQLQLGFDARTAYRAARCLLELGRGLGEAEALCRKAIDRAETDEKTDMACTLAQILERLERKKEACDLYAEVLRNEPGNSLAKLELERLSHAPGRVSG